LWQWVCHTQAERKEKTMFGIFEKQRHLVPLIIRVVVGLMFLLHGLQKFGVFGGGGIQGVIGMFGNWGIPAPGIMAPLVALIELVGGLLLILGLGTRIVTIPLIIIMLVAIFAVKIQGGINPIGNGGYEVDLLMLVTLVSLLILGSGPLALERKVLNSRMT
jgi:uncharacterized membrane protein YphA (DoxX/SURF4 family)